MTQDTFQLEGSAARIYEEQKVSAIFGPLARATLDAVPIQAGDKVLDVACGTGIVARTIRDRYGADVEVTGSDLNAGMIEMAGVMTSEFDPPIQWSVADATALPFGDGAFSVCLCQQGIQFIPDKLAALTEFYRVLSPGGRLVISVWNGPSGFFIAMADALRRHIGEAVAEKSLAPFVYQGGDKVPPMMEEVGYRNISIRTLTIKRVTADPESEIPKEIFSNPVGPTVREKGEATLRRIVREIIADCAEYQVGSTLVVPQSAHLITASSAA